MKPQMDVVWRSVNGGNSYVVSTETGEVQGRVVRSGDVWMAQLYPSLMLDFWDLGQAKKRLEEEMKADELIDYRFSS